jgi:hypothetical protein
MVAQASNKLLGRQRLQGKIMVQASPGIKQDPISKITTGKRAGSVIQVVEHLPSKHESLGSIPVSPKKLLVN